VVTCIDDHSRFIVCAKVVVAATVRAAAQMMAAAFVTPHTDMAKRPS
jgi:hypothetical protein